MNIKLIALWQVEDLRWEVEQRQRELESQKQQMEASEQCSHRELDNLQSALQVTTQPHPLVSH